MFLFRFADDDLGRKGFSSENCHLCAVKWLSARTPAWTWWRTPTGKMGCPHAHGVCVWGDALKRGTALTHLLSEGVTSEL